MQLFDARQRTSRRTFAMCVLASPFFAGTLSAQPVFPDVFDGKPLATPLKPGEVETDALRQFKANGVNPYRQDAQAIAAGKAVYEEWCQVCHNPDAKGKMGPSLLGPNYTYTQTATDVGMFAVIYGGASGAMQPFSKRDVTQDQMLKVIAYIRSLPR